MKFCVPIPCFFGNLDFCEALRKVREAGFDIAETYNWTGLDLDRVGKTCVETGVELRSICTTEFRMTDPRYRDLWLDGLKASCEAANRVGATRIITQVGNDTGDAREYQHASVVEALIAAGPILNAHGVTVMIEPLNCLVDHIGTYLCRSGEAFAMIREVNHPYVKVVYDIYHQQVTEGNIINSITKNLDCIAHLHSAGHPGRHELQSGETDYKNVFAAIDRAGYVGACGLEYIPTVKPEDSLAEFRRIYL